MPRVVSCAKAKCIRCGRPATNVFFLHTYPNGKEPKAPSVSTCKRCFEAACKHDTVEVTLWQQSWDWLHKKLRRKSHG